MTTQALLEALPNHRYRVTGSGRFAVYGEGSTPNEAIAAFRQAVRQAKIIIIDLSDSMERTPIEEGEVSDETWNDFLDLIDQQRREDNAVFAVKHKVA